MSRCQKIAARLILCLVVLAALGAEAARQSCAFAQAAPLVLRISSENTPDHLQSQVIQRFVDRLQAKTAGRVVVQYFNSARLYRDRDVIAAMMDGKVEMAVPGIWQLDRFEPNFALPLLPVFYGREQAVFHHIADGPVGQELGRRLSEAVNVEVLGRWIDLGYAHLYFTDQLQRPHPTLSGAVIRVAGGRANMERIRALHAEPLTIAWPDLPAALSNGRVQGVLSTHETIVSAALWDNGLTWALEDREYFPQYVPLIARNFWKKLPPDLQQSFRDAWEEGVEDARQQAESAQQAAREQLLAHGVQIIVPSAEERAETRRALMPLQQRLVPDLGLDSALLRQVSEGLAP